jgi:hypothetical protein
LEMSHLIATASMRSALFIIPSERDKGVNKL